MVPRNIKLTIAYDGTNYHGWQIQPGYRTVQGTVSEAVEALIAPARPRRRGPVKPLTVHGASRTDAGVSALGQVGLFQMDRFNPIPVENLARAITDRLPPDIAVVGAVEVPAGFDLIGGVKSKLYRYSIFTGEAKPVLDRHCWHVPGGLDAAAMSDAAGRLVGTKDYKSFAAAADRRQSTVRTVIRCEVRSQGEMVYVEIEADGFLYNMARNIVGTLVEVGRGRIEPAKMDDIIEARSRTAAGPICPPQGLCLMWVKH
jgi:tRNA pseudouridine38-40 synthase